MQHSKALIFSILIVLFFAILLFRHSDKLVSVSPKVTRFIGKNNNNNAQSNSASSDSSTTSNLGTQFSPPSTSSSSVTTTGGDVVVEDENNKDDKDEDGYRKPILNGHFGPDPNRRWPCIIGGDWAFRFNDPNRYIYQFIPEQQILPTHYDDGQYCLPGFEVPNTVFNLQFESHFCCVYVPALHIPSGLFVGADIHFFDYIYRSVVNTKDFGKWHQRLVKETEIVRRRIDDKFWIQYQKDRWGNSSFDEENDKNNNNKNDNNKNNNNNKKKTTINISSRKANSKILRPENVYIKSEWLKGTSISLLPVDTEYVHMLITDLVGMMPAVSIAQFLSYWGHFYTSGIQALGKKKVTVVINRRKWGRNGELVDQLVRYLPVNALYIPANRTFLAKRLTFAPRGYNDVLEPCTFHLLRHYLVPTVVSHFRKALLKTGRPTKKNSLLGGNRPATLTPGGHDDWLVEAHRHTREVEHDVFLRRPVDPNKARPWWAPEYDELIKNPPEGLAILKSKKGAYSGRILESTLKYEKLLKQNNFISISDAAPADVRIYLINHCKRLIVMWGGGANVASHFWGGGVSKKIRYLDVIMLIHPGYDWEFQGFYGIPLKKAHALEKKRKVIQANLTTFIGPPNPHDQWSEAAFSFAYAWTKMIRIGNLDRLEKEHLYITDEEKKRDYGPSCDDRLLANAVGRNRTKTRYEFVAP